MKPSTGVYVIIPAYNEEKAIARVLAAIPSASVDEVVVCNNGSTDATAAQARAQGATVVNAPARGYGNACLAGLAYLAQKEAGAEPQVVVFLDGDYSDFPEEMPLVLAPIQSGSADLVIGSRVLGPRPPKGALQPQQIFGNWLATRLIKWLFGVGFTDLGPFRAITWQALQQLDLRDRNYGWTVEMQVKAAKLGLHCVEVPVRYRPRIGVSKVSGTLKGSILAGYKIIFTIFKNW